MHDPAGIPTAPTAPAPTRRPLSRAMQRARRLKARLAQASQATVRLLDWETVQISRVGGIGWREHKLGESPAKYHIVPATLVCVLPDASALARLSASGLLTGKIRKLRVRLDTAPEWLTVGVRPLRIGRDTEEVVWRRRENRLELEFGWSRPYDVHRALANAAIAVLRARPWDQTGGPVYALDRTAWLEGRSSWPQGHIVAGPPPVKSDDLGRRLGPYWLPEAATPGPTPLVSAVANPYGRRLVGAAAPYRLTTDGDRSTLRDGAGQVVLRFDPALGPEAAILNGTLTKYAVVTVDSPVRPGTYLADALRALAGCGVVFAAADPGIRAGLDALGLVAVADAAEVTDLAGYALSVGASRRMAITGDAALRRTALGGEGALPLPTVSVALSSMRADHVETCLGYLANQTYPAVEVVAGLHGYDVPEETRERWRAILPFPLRVVPFPAELTFGMVLGQLSRIAEGELITKVDDDDHYGANHITDLVIALHTSGADLAAKGSRFVHFAERDETIDRAWAAPEHFNVTPAGGTLTLARSTLQQIGGWSHSSRHVDTDLLTRIKSAGGLVYRTHALEYVYVRRSTGHTWVTDLNQVMAQSERVYKGLPQELIEPRYSPSW